MINDYRLVQNKKVLKINTIDGSTQLTVHTLYKPIALNYRVLVKQVISTYSI